MNNEFWKYEGSMTVFYCRFFQYMMQMGPLNLIISTNLIRCSNSRATGQCRRELKLKEDKSVTWLYEKRAEQNTWSFYYDQKLDHVSVFPIQTRWFRMDNQEDGRYFHNFTHYTSPRATTGQPSRDFYLIMTDQYYKYRLPIQQIIRTESLKKVQDILHNIIFNVFSSQ